MITSAGKVCHRQQTYYWKCDRPAAFHGTLNQPHPHEKYLVQVHELLSRLFPGPILVAPGKGQGNHVTFSATCGTRNLFIRIEDGPEQDHYLEVESFVQREARNIGIPTPVIYAVDCSRKQHPFSWQVMELIDHADLNQLLKAQELQLENTAFDIGVYVARWQSITPLGFGPFNLDHILSEQCLHGLHARYEDYFFLHFERHLNYLKDHGFLNDTLVREIKDQVIQCSSLLMIERGCLVHKDLALWNMLGTSSQIHAFIDWDDAISGDCMDDLSLLGCFYSGSVVEQAVQGYASQRPLPQDYVSRFWLHLLRNMLVKAVIRIGAGYFQRSSGFFLVNDGVDLKTFTHQRLLQALEGLRRDAPISTLG